LRPRKRQDARNVWETNASPWSQTIVSGTITGRAAACCSGNHAIRDSARTDVQ
jgi:hypothetical protein